MYPILTSYLIQIATFLQPAGSTPAAPSGGGGAAPAPGAGPGCDGGGGGGMSTLLMLGIMFFILYFFMIRPQQKKAKTHQEMLSALKKGDRVITNGGLIGRVHSLTDKVANVEIANGVKVEVLRSQIAGLDAPEGEKK